MSNITITKEYTPEEIRERIMFVLGVYPGISNSMLQVGIGTTLSTAQWKPVFNEMVVEGAITNKPQLLKSTAGRTCNYTKLFLA